MRSNTANPSPLELPLAGLFGLVMALLAVGSPAGGDMLANLDLIALGDLDIDESIVGLGPDLPRRAPLQVFWALVSPPLSAATAMRVWMIVILVGATVGMVRQLRDIPRPLRFGAAVAYSLSPFLLTRLSVGHLGFASAVALLPWVVDDLLDPLLDRRRTFRALLGFAVCGYFGFLVAGPVLGVGLIWTQRRFRATDLAWVAVSQVPWLLTALDAIGSARGAESAASFETDVSTAADAVRLVLGYGFWRSPNQLGTQHPFTVAVGGVLFLLCLAGVFWGRNKNDRRVALLGVLGAAVAVSSRVPWVRDGYDQLSSTVVFAPIRESQRFLAFSVMAVFVLAARGLAVLTEDRPIGVQRLAGLALGSVALVSLPAFGGLGGAARGHTMPLAWGEAARTVEGVGGATLALPFDRYFDVAVAEDTRAHHPVPYLVDGDVIFAHDLGLGSRIRGRDEREDQARLFIRALRLGEPVEDRLVDLGLRWIVALPDVDGGADIRRLRDLGLSEVVTDATISVFEVAPEDPVNGPAWSTVATLILAADLAWLVLVAGAVWPRDHRLRVEWRAV